MEGQITAHRILGTPVPRRDRSCANARFERLVARVEAFTFGRGLDNPDIGPLEPAALKA